MTDLQLAGAACAEEASADVSFQEVRAESQREGKSQRYSAAGIVLIAKNVDMIDRLKKCTLGSFARDVESQHPLLC
jgi:hypothetical protein